MQKLDELLKSAFVSAIVHLKLELESRFRSE